MASTAEKGDNVETTIASGMKHTPEHFGQPFFPRGVLLGGDEVDAPLHGIRHALPRRPAAVQYEFTRDAALLHQYSLLLPLPDPREVALDAAGEVLIMRLGKLCVGGARLNFSTARAREPLPMEDERFSLAERLPDLNLEKRSYAECGRFTVLPDFQSDATSLALWSHLLRRAHERGAEYLFALAPSLQTRANRLLAGLLGVPCKTYMNLKVPQREEYEGVQMYLSSFDITRLSAAALEAREHQLADELA